MKIQLHCPLNPTGVGTHAQHLARALIETYYNDDVDFQLEIIPMGVVQYSTEQLHSRLIRGWMMKQKPIHDPDVVIVLNVPAVCVSWRRQQPHLNPRAKIVFYTVFELSANEESAHKIMQDYELLLDLSDEVWVPSLWAQKEIEQLCLPEGDKVKVLHEGADLMVSTTPEDWDDETLRVVTIGKFEKRKGHHELIKALEHWGTDHIKKVELHAYWHNFWFPGHHRRYMHEWSLLDEHEGVEEWSYGSTDNVKIFCYPHQKWQTAALERAVACDLAVFPSFAEGWGLPALECMVHAVPTISVSHTGPWEYWEKYDQVMRNAMGTSGYKAPPTHFRESILSQARDDMFFTESCGSWAVIPWTEILHRMEQAAHPIGRLRNMRPFLDQTLSSFREEFSWQASAKKLLELLGA